MSVSSRSSRLPRRQGSTARGSPRRRPARRTSRSTHSPRPRRSWAPRRQSDSTRPTGPRLRDHLQVRLIETLLERLHPRWEPRLEVPVYRPVRGVIDLVLVDAEAGEIVGGEAHSEIRRVERQLRWAAEKVDALPSASGWPWMPGEPRVSRLLLLRSTRATRDVVSSAPVLFRAAHPGRSADALAALTRATASFPDAAIVWVDLRGTASRLLDGPPWSITVGR